MRERKKGFDYLIFTDDVKTGTRFLKLYDEHQPGRGAASDRGGAEIAGYRLLPRQIAWTLPSDDCGSRLVGETRRLFLAWLSVPLSVLRAVVLTHC
jgi:hypothetical protein